MFFLLAIVYYTGSQQVHTNVLTFVSFFFFSSSDRLTKRVQFCCCCCCCCFCWYCCCCSVARTVVSVCSCSSSCCCCSFARTAVFAPAAAVVATALLLLLLGAVIATTIPISDYRRICKQDSAKAGCGPMHAQAPARRGATTNDEAGRRAPVSRPPAADAQGPQLLPAASEAPTLQFMLILIIHYGIIFSPLEHIIGRSSTDHPHFKSRYFWADISIPDLYDLCDLV